MNSGSSRTPPTKLKPPSSGLSKRIGNPIATSATSGGATTSARPVHNSGNCRPVRIWRRLAQSLSAIVAITLKAKTAMTAPVPSRAGGGGGDRRGRDDAAVVEEDRAEQRDALARSRQRAQHGEIPKQELAQERQVADQLDIPPRQPRNEPIARQPREADEEAEDGREHDTDRSDQQRVEKADEEHAGVGVRFVVRNERLVDAEARRVVEEAEAAGDFLRVEIGLGVEREFEAQPQHRRQQDELIKNGADLRAVVDGNPRRGQSALELD